MSLNEQLQREQNIKQEMNRLKKLYKDLPKEKQKAIEGLIKDAAFIKITLEEFRAVLIKNGTTEIFKQGKQELKVERHESKLYIPYVQKYSQIMKQLIELIPGKASNDEKDELMAFLKKSKVKK